MCALIPTWPSLAAAKTSSVPPGLVAYDISLPAKLTPAVRPKLLLPLRSLSLLKFVPSNLLPESIGLVAFRGRPALTLGRICGADIGRGPGYVSPTAAEPSSPAERALIPPPLAAGEMGLCNPPPNFCMPASPGPPSSSHGKLICRRGARPSVSETSWPPPLLALDGWVSSSFFSSPAPKFAFLVTPPRPMLRVAPSCPASCGGCGTEQPTDDLSITRTRGRSPFPSCATLEAKGSPLPEQSLLFTSPIAATAAAAAADTLSAFSNLSWEGLVDPFFPPATPVATAPSAETTLSDPKLPPPFRDRPLSFCVVDGGQRGTVAELMLS